MQENTAPTPFIGKQCRGLASFTGNGCLSPPLRPLCTTMTLGVEAATLLQPSMLGFQPEHSFPCPPHPLHTTPNACGARGEVHAERGASGMAVFAP